MRTYLSFNTLKAMILLFFELLFFTSCSTYEVERRYVYVCNGKKSYAYHYNPYCRGLNRCSTALEKITEKEAIKRKRRLCGFED